MKVQGGVLIKIVLSFLLLTFSISSATASDLRTFLKYCGYGTLGGALVGVVSLAFVDKPSEHYNNIARGASLGLYTGIGIGLYQMNQPEATGEFTQVYFAPQINEKHAVDAAGFLVVHRF